MHGVAIATYRRQQPKRRHGLPTLLWQRGGSSPRPSTPQTYRNLVYLALAFPLGLVYFVGLVTGGALGLGLLITVVGLPILLLTVVGATLAAGLEAHLTTHLAGVPTPVPEALREFDAREGLALPGDGFLDATRHLVTAPSTWTSVVVVLTKFVFGLASFVALVTAGAVGTALLAAPVAYNDPSAAVTSAARRQSDSTASVRGSSTRCRRPWPSRPGVSCSSSWHSIFSTSSRAYRRSTPVRFSARTPIPTLPDSAQRESYTGTQFGRHDCCLLGRKRRFAG